ncbi:MAG: GNAT family N-acetyltransferase [Ignavibacteria bacterium]
METKEFRIRELRESEIRGLNKLPPVDWKFDYEAFLLDFKNDDFFYAFVMTINDEIIGTGNVLLKDKVGWLANIIVIEKLRGKGLGYQMTKFLVDFLRDKGCETQLLIATELGEPVYRKIGFRKIAEYQCFDTEEDYDYKIPNEMSELKSSDLEHVIMLDSITNGENRSHLIRKYFKGGFGYYSTDNELLGFYLPCFGRGLVVSKDVKAGQELLSLKHSEKGQRTLLPIDNIVGNNYLKKKGLKKGYKCSRMFLGKENNWIPTNIYSYGSGYCG